MRSRKVLHFLFCSPTVIPHTQSGLWSLNDNQSKHNSKSMNEGMNDLSFELIYPWSLLGSSYKSKSTEDAYTVYLFYMFCVYSCLFTCSHSGGSRWGERSTRHLVTVLEWGTSAQLLIVISHSFRVRGREAGISLARTGPGEDGEANCAIHQETCSGPRGLSEQCRTQTPSVLTR